MLYRIYTEDKNRNRIVEIVGLDFQGFTIYPALGYWNGMPENSLVIEILGSVIQPQKDELAIWKIANRIKEENQQEAVLITIQEIKKTMI